MFFNNSRKLFSLIWFPTMSIILLGLYNNVGRTLLKKYHGYMVEYTIPLTDFIYAFVLIFCISIFLVWMVGFDYKKYEGNIR